MRRFYALIVVGIMVFCNACATTSLSRAEMDRLASTLNYEVMPAELFGTEKDVRIHYEEAGRPELPVMILIHGFGSSTVTWKECLPRLSKHYDVILLDMPGFGFSDNPADFPYGIDAYGKVVLEFMNRRHIKKAIIGGNSMGGGISLWMAINHPDRLTHLILIDSAGYPHESSSLISLTRKSWLRPLAKPFYGKFVLKTGLKDAYYDDSKVTPELVELYGRPFATENAKDVPFWLFQRFKESDSEGMVKQIQSIKTPTLIIWGENDTWIPVEHAHFFHRDIKGSKLFIIQECGHVPQEEKPKDVIEAILGFF